MARAAAGRRDRRRRVRRSAAEGMRLTRPRLTSRHRAGWAPRQAPAALRTARAASAGDAQHPGPLEVGRAASSRARSGVGGAGAGRHPVPPPGANARSRPARARDRCGPPCLRPGPRSTASWRTGGSRSPGDSTPEPIRSASWRRSCSYGGVGSSTSTVTVDRVIGPAPRPGRPHPAAAAGRSSTRMLGVKHQTGEQAERRARGERARRPQRSR